MTKPEPPHLLSQIVALLEPGTDEPLRFAPKAPAEIARLLAGLTDAPDTIALPAITALIGLMVALRAERRSPGAARVLEVAIERSLPALRALIVLDRSNQKRAQDRQKMLAAPRSLPVSTKPQAGAIKLSSLANASDLERRARAKR